MLLNEREILISKVKNHDGLLKYVSDEVLRKLAPNEMPVRFVISLTDDKGYQCELGVLSDINEYPENALYVEGSVLSRLLMGTVGLQKVRSNRVMLVIDKHRDKFFHESAVNAVSAARAALGLECPAVIMMDDKILMHSLYSISGRAV